MNEFDLDTKLEEPGQKAVSKLVRELPEDMPSLAWRSGLNEQILANAHQRAKRHRIGFFLRPLAGLAVAGALATVLFVSQRPAVGGPVVEGAIVENYQTHRAVADLGAFTLTNAVEPKGAALDTAAIEFDLESL